MINRLVLLVTGMLVLSMQQALADNTVFIEDLPPLGQDADRTGAMIWLKPDLDRAYYTQVMIEAHHDLHQSGFEIQGPERR